MNGGNLEASGHVVVSMATALPRTILYEQPETAGNLEKLHLRRYEAPGFHLSETRHEAGSKIPRHAHETSSMYLLLEGCVTEDFGRGWVRREERELIFTPAGEPHANEFDTGGRCFFVELDAATMARAEEYGRLPAKVGLLRGRLPLLARKLYAEFRRDDEVLPLMVESIGLEMVAEMCREDHSRGTPGWLREAKELLDDCFRQPVSLGAAARAAGAHPVHLARVFRREYGCSVGEYVRRLRIEAACRELARCEVPLAEVAASCGFADQSHFCRTFRAAMDMSPSEYRRASRRR